MLAVDPGRSKCGLAVVDAQAGVLHREVAAADRLEARVEALMASFAPDAVVVGDRTGAGEVSRRLRALPAVQAVGGAVPVDEAGTSWEARRRYFQANPPRGLWRLVPVGLRVPPVPVDDWAAVVLAERYLASAPGSKRGG